MISEYSTVSAAQELAAEIGPHLILVSGPAFGDCLRIWNGAVHHRPAVVVRTETPSDVQAAVRTAKTRFDSAGMFSAIPLPGTAEE
jgi:hypothetical protein